ncbi:MAG TPA: flavodoxin domain-containing protein [Acidimicrobiia bacterium]|nr:flavodoxin domain-containing protein [Acidimicrobiia bacterium]
MKVLVSAASKHGATAGIADVIGSTLMGSGFEVSMMEPGRIDDIDSFDAIVVGSAVYAGHWMKPAIELTERFAERFPDKPVWLFSSGPIGDPPKPSEDPVDLVEVMKMTGARGHRLFAGKLDKAMLSFPERAIVSALRAPYGDFRDWDEIRNWANEIAMSLSEVAAPRT